MPYCKKCGAELPEYAVFCTKCGLKYPVSGVTDNDYSAPSQTEQTTAQQVQPVVQNPAPVQQSSAPIQQGATSTPTKTQSVWFKNNSMALFIILGVVSYVLLQLCSTIVYSSFAFGVVLGVFSILCAIAFCTIGIIRYVMICKTAGKKCTTCDNVCLALGIICVVYVLITTIVVLKSASDLLDAQQAISGILR